jgi:thermitase
MRPVSGPYTPEDFGGLGIPIKKVEDLTEQTYELIQMQLEAEKAGRWNEELEELRKTNMLVNVKDYQKVLSLTLAEKGKDMVVRAFEQFRKSERQDILYAGPDYVVTPCAMPNDPLTGNQWALGQIQLPDAWEIATGSQSVKVGILDSGIYAEHEDLRNRVNRTLSRDFLTTPPTTPNPVIDPLGHGTHVAGICGAEGNNNTGVAGVCWNVELVSLRVLDDVGWGYSSNVARAIDFAGRQGIPILNLSAREPIKFFV